MRIRAGGLSDIGQRRKNNEDSFSLDERQSFYVVADGVGGQPAGEIASRLVTDRLPEFLAKQQGEGKPEELLGSAISEVNDLLRREAERNPAWRGMSTTVVAAWFRDDEVCLANVGDSRAYLVRGQVLEQLSEDHTVLAEQQRQGLADVGTTSRMAHVLTRCLGLESEIEASLATIAAKDGDRILLCSDGLTDSLSEDVIRSIILSASGPGEACRMLIELANRNGGHDNITVLLIFLEEGTLKTKITNLFGRRS
ncbi:MAG: serine/threonine protein phosphatase [Desulfuromonas sp.]|nr:MAG: serine/threonine protein phosphatase [Desulfuromonas sp.]